MDKVISQLTIIKNLIESRSFEKAYNELTNLEIYSDELDIDVEAIKDCLKQFNFGETVSKIDKHLYDSLLIY